MLLVAAGPEESICLEERGGITSIARLPAHPPACHLSLQLTLTPVLPFVLVVSFSLLLRISIFSGQALHINLALIMLTSHMGDESTELQLAKNTLVYGFVDEAIFYILASLDKLPPN